jgi:hypothetical protein
MACPDFDEAPFNGYANRFLMHLPLVPANIARE